MTKRLTPLRLSLALSLSILIAPAIAAAQPPPAPPSAGEGAGQAFERGVKFFKDGDYVAAMVQFKRAYELDPNYAVLYNIGQTARELKSYSEALRALERYLTEGGDKISAERRASVEGWVTELKDRVAATSVQK